MGRSSLVELLFPFGVVHALISQRLKNPTLFPQTMVDN